MMNVLFQYLGRTKPLALAIVGVLGLMCYGALGYIQETSIAIAALVASERTQDQIDGLVRIITGTAPVLGFFSLVATGLIGALSKSMDPPDNTASELIDAINRVVELNSPPPPATPQAPERSPINIA